MIHRKDELITDGLKKKTLVRLPSSGCSVTHEESSARSLRFLVGEDDPQRRIQPESAHSWRTRCAQLNPAKRIGRSLGKQPDNGRDGGCVRARESGNRILGPLLPYFSRTAHRDNAPAHTQMLCNLGSRRSKDLSRRGLAVHQTIDFRDGREVAMRFRSGRRWGCLRSGASRNGERCCSRDGRLLRKRLGRGALRPPIRALVERAQAIVTFLLAGKKLRDSLDAFDRFRLQ